MTFNPKSLDNLKQNRPTKSEVIPDSTSILPIGVIPEGPMTNQRLARDIAVTNAPGMVKVLVDTAYGRGRGISHAVRVQAASKVLEAAGISAPTQTRPPVDGVAGMSHDELQAFVLAGTQALRLREAAKQAVDAEVIAGGEGAIS